jgi:RNA polymerase sigma factor (sigma-70 family)
VASDSELAIAAASGDRGALADIYDRYANTLHELCRVILGDAHEAADALQDTFVIASTRLASLRDPERLKPWLCAIARHEAIRRSSKRARMRPARDEVLDVPVTDDAAAAGLVAGDAFNLVWDSAEGLTERERAVLELNVRQGLEGADLAAAVGLPGPATSVLLSRAKTQLAAAVRCTLLIRGGREACAELASIAPRKHAALDGLTRKRVTRHASECAICEPKWNASPDALGVLAAAPLLGAPVALRHKVLNDPRLISSSRPLGGPGWQSDGFPPIEKPSRRRVLAALIAAAALLLLAAGLVLAGDNDDTPQLAAPVERSTTTEPGDEEFFAPWPTDPQGQRITTTTRRGATTTTTRRPATTTTRPSGGVTPPTTAPTTTTTEPRLIISAGSRANTLACGESTVVSATTSGRPMAQGEGLLLTFRDSSGSGGTVSMSFNGSTWTGNLGPFSTPGTATWSVSSNQGNYAPNNHTIDVTPNATGGC